MRNFFFILLLGIIQLTYAQDQFNPSSINYTVEDGLPSNETYCIHQDKLGYIWIGTDRGLCRYNGYEFETFTKIDGLKDNVIFKIIEDNSGRLWFITYNYSLFYFEKEKFITYEYNKKWLNFINSSKNRPQTINNIVVSPENDLYISFALSGFIKISRDGEIKADHFVNTPSKFPEIASLNIDFIAGEPFCYGYSNKGITKTYHYVNYNQKKHLVPSALPPKRTNIIVTSKELSFTSIGTHSVFKLKKNSLEKSSDSNIYIAIYHDGGQYWYGYNNQGVKSESGLHLFREKSISSILKDRDGGYWFCSLNSGLFYIPHFTVTRLFPFASNNQIYRLVKLDSSIFYSSFNKKTGIINDKTNHLIRSIEQLQKTNFSSVLDVKYSSRKKKIIIITSDTLSIIDFPNISIDTTIYTPAKLAQPYKNSVLVFNQQSKQILFSQEKESIVKNKTPLENTPFSSHIDQESNLWFSTINGLFMFHDIDSSTYYGNKHPLLKERISSIHSIGSNLWLGTTGNGLLKYNYRNGSLNQITQEDGLNSNNINHIINDSLNNTWVATNDGISIIPSSFPKMPIKRLNTNNGLTSNEIFHLVLFKNNIYAGTRKGIIKIDSKEYLKKNSKSISPLIKYLKVNNDIYKDLKNIEFSYDSNNIEIEYITISYNNGGAINYFYRLIGQDTTWYKTANKTVRFLNLPHGEYTFEVKSQNQDGIWSYPTQSSFTIHPAFWQTTWFSILVILTILLVISGTIIIRFRTIATKKELESSVERFRYRALTSQMNPHFVFNALNSIQYFILGQDRRAASKYLSTFAKLIRASFENSKLELIPLEDELDALRLYMDLENLRLENKVELSFEVDVNINLLDTRVPPLLIQPFVENAFLHGLAPKKEGEMKLSVELKDQPKYIYCKIEDNGIGREAAKELKKAKDLRRRKSSGMSMTEDRLDAFAQLQNLKDNSYKVEITDLFDGNKSPTGTIVELFIPKTFSTTN